MCERVVKINGILRNLWKYEIKKKKKVEKSFYGFYYVIINGNKNFKVVYN